MWLRITFICVISHVSLFAEGHFVMDSLAMRLQHPAGVKMMFNIVQHQLGEQWTEMVTMELLDQNHFIFKSPSQIIKIDRESVYTFNPQTRQVVADHLFREEFSLFDILTGNFQQVAIKELRTESETIIIDFNISKMGYVGKIWVDRLTYRPLKIILDYGAESNIEINIETFHPLSEAKMYVFYSLDNWEVIDLRE